MELMDLQKFSEKKLFFTVFRPFFGQIYIILADFHRFPTLKPIFSFCTIIVTTSSVMFQLASNLTQITLRGISNISKEDFFIFRLFGFWRWDFSCAGGKNPHFYVFFVQKNVKNQNLKKSSLETLETIEMNHHTKF